MIKNNYKIFVSATEQSGDNIGYNIIQKILESNNQIIFEGNGGSKMSKLLNKKFFDINDFNSMGIFEIIFSLKKYIKMINFLFDKIINNNYDLIITIDSPDFNYALAKKLKKKLNKIKIIHIVAPSVWAWRPSRAKKFSKIYDELLILFNFEAKYFAKYNLKTKFIGHPIFYINSLQNLNKINYKKIAFLPGSRMSELNKLLPYFLIAYEYLLTYSPHAIIFIPTLPHLRHHILKFVSNWKLKVIVSIDYNQIEKNFYNTSHALVCSGTASLEIAKRNIPQLVIYKLNFFTVLIGKIFVKVKFANILNIIDNKIIIPEITNFNLNKKIFLHKFENLIFSKKDNTHQINEVNRVLKSLLTQKPPYTLAANYIKSLMN